MTHPPKKGFQILFTYEVIVQGVYGSEDFNGIKVWCIFKVFLGSFQVKVVYEFSIKLKALHLDYFYFSKSDVKVCSTSQ